MRKSYLTPEAWDAICRKRTARKTYYQLNYAEKTALLKAVFNAWNKRQDTPLESRSLKKRYQELACAEREFRAANSEANRLNRRDDKRFYDDLTRRITDNDEPALQNRLWKTIRRLLPKYRQRRATMNSAKLASLDGEWLPHLCQLEAGEALEMEEIYKRCIEAHNRVPQGDPSLEDLPELVATEKALRKSQPGRAPGSDGLQASWMHYGAHLLAPACFDLYVKSALWNTEPVHFKGGAVTMLEKVPGVREVSKFRSIVLMGILAKRLHALGREKLIQVLDEKRTDGQIGGFAHQEVMFGSMAMRMFTRTAHATGRPTATMFFDLTAAYHGLVRQGVVGGDEMDLAAMKTLTETLIKEGQDASMVLKVLDQPGILRQMGASETLVRQLAEYHTNTWTCIKGDAAMTHRGSRPGSPLADAMFLTEMAGILQSIKDLLKGYHTCQIAWADDLAICVWSHTNNELEDSIKDIIRFVNEQFSKRGMCLNFAKGKTEIIVSNRGEGAGEKRRQFLQMERPAINVETHEGKVVPVLCVGSYKHLGSWMECGGLLGTEIERRVAIAWSTFHMLRRPLLSNRKLKLQTRVRLFESLVMTKMLFGAGAWYILPRRCLKKLQTAYVKMLRIISGQQYRPQEEHPKTDEEVLGMLLLPDVRVRLARDRLLYARRMFLRGPSFLQQMAQEEEKATNDSWLAGVKADLQWAKAVNGHAGWGQDYDETCTRWTGGQPGWKNFVVKAVEKHVLQEEHARRIIQKEAVGKDGSHNPTQAFACDCGKWFLSNTARAVHQRIAHEKHAEEYMIASGTQCEVCLKELWTEQRLRAHLHYRPRNGKENRCFGVYKAQYNLRSHEMPSKEVGNTVVPMLGLRRRECVQHCGPLRCGARASDVQYVKDELNSCLDGFVCTDFDGNFSKYVNQSLLATLSAIPEGCHDVVERWIEALESEGNAVVVTVSFLVWGSQQKWQNPKGKEQWSEFLEELHMGKALKDYYKVFRDYLFALEADKHSWRGEWQPAAANTSERIARDSKVPRKVDGLRDRRDHLSAVVRSSHTRPHQLRKLLA